MSEQGYVTGRNLLRVITNLVSVHGGNAPSRQAIALWRRGIPIPGYPCPTVIKGKKQLAYSWLEANRAVRWILDKRLLAKSIIITDEQIALELQRFFRRPPPMQLDLFAKTVELTAFLSNTEYYINQVRVRRLTLSIVRRGLPYIIIQPPG